MFVQSVKGRQWMLRLVFLKILPVCRSRRAGCFEGAVGFYSDDSTSVKLSFLHVPIGIDRT